MVGKSAVTAVDERPVASPGTSESQTSKPLFR
jgi:hypothetical protein